MRLTPGSKVRVPEERPGEAMGEDAAQLLCKSQHFGDANTMDDHQGQQQPWRGAHLSYKSCACDRGQIWRSATGEPFGAHRIMSGSQM